MHQNINFIIVCNNEHFHLIYHFKRVKSKYIGICGLVGRATAGVRGDVGSTPTCGALEVWSWTFGFRTVWLVNKSAGQPQVLTYILYYHCLIVI